MAGEDGDENDPSDPAYWKKFLGEGHTPFEPAPADKPTLQTMRSLYSNVLSNYGYACAMTGTTFEPPRDLLHDKLEITAIQPMHLGGALHVSNFLCLEAVAAQAFRAGYITVGPQWQLLADLSGIDPELMERLNPDGRLQLPEAEVGRPDAAALRFHRDHIFARP